MTVTLTEFLLARIAEDEKAVRDIIEGRVFDLAEDLPIGCWGFARVLAECESKRRIVEEHAAYPTPQKMVGGTIIACSTCGSVDDSPVEWPCDTLKALALPRVDHPDYREEWKP